MNPGAPQAMHAARFDPAAPSWTWWPDDQTAGFWLRRMAQETAVHRVDVELPLGATTPTRWSGPIVHET